MSVLLVMWITAPPGSAQAPPADAPQPPDPAGSGSSAEAAPSAEDSEATEIDPASEFDAADELEFDLDEEIDEIVIEGTRTSTLKTAPISGTEFNAADLSELRIQNVSDLAQYTPNLEINTAFAASNPTLFVRGIGLKDYNANAAGAVAIYQDGIYINSPAAQLFQLFDI
jgi:hypothetical protein